MTGRPACRSPGRTIATNVGRLSEGGIGGEAPVARQHAAQAAIERERRRELRHRLDKAIAGDRCVQDGREIVIVGGSRHPEPCGTRIHAARVQVPR